MLRMRTAHDRAGVEPSTCSQARRSHRAQTPARLKRGGPSKRRTSLTAARGAVTLLLLAFLASLLFAGCGGKDTIAGDTPKATAEGFIEAMKAGDYKKVAQGFEFETYARANNDDWDSIPPGQRSQIVGKLRENQAGELEALAGMFTGEASVGNVQEQGGSATVIINAGANTLLLQMKQMEDEWLISSMVEQTG